MNNSGLSIKSLTKQGCLHSLFHFNNALLSSANATKHEVKIRGMTAGHKDVKLLLASVIKYICLRKSIEKLPELIEELK